MGKHTDHTKIIDDHNDTMTFPKHRCEETAAPLSATGHASLAAEYSGMGIDPALVAIVEEKPKPARFDLTVYDLDPSPLNEWVDGVVRREMAAEQGDLEAIIVTGSPMQQRRRFTVRRLQITLQWARNPWVIKDRERPSFIGQAPTHEAAMMAIDNLQREVRSSGLIGVDF